VLLYHIPTTPTKNEQAGISLQLFGHTHCGQIFPVNILMKGMYDGFVGGLKQVGSGLSYTSCGVGGWRIPVRTSGQSEIVVFEF